MTRPAVRHLPIAADLPVVPGASPSSFGDEKLFKIGDLAKAGGKTVRAIHHYEDMGLLQPHARSKGRYRLYDDQSVVRVRWIGKLHDLGFSLAEIKLVVASWEASPSAPSAMAEVKQLYRDKLEETRAQIARLSGLERELAASIEYLDTCDTCDPAALVAACSSCNVRDRQQEEPELVAGIYSSQGTDK